MRDFNEVYKEKLAALTRVTKEVEALRIIAPLLMEPSDSGGTVSPSEPPKEPVKRWP